ncbi:MAG: GAF domain-containing protein [Candidatus Marinimicrobia bacterium]|nr:GAF domain-containing protein [Candidatus Neomarinimicrobiota bacterium]
MTEKFNIKNPLVISESMISKWQNIVNIIALIIDVPAALIMRLVKTEIEVFIASQSKKNPYHAGDKEHFLNSGLYCETVLQSNNKLLVPNALESDQWKNNPDIKLNMISYLGYPIHFPNGEPFGTICILDNKENAFSKSTEDLLQNFREILEDYLQIVYMNNVLGEENNKLTDYIAEIKNLRGLIPICANCKKIKDSQGYWTRVERYIEDHTNAKFTHGYCEDCLEKLYGNQSWYRKALDKKE